jgi:hypothetical protein
MKRNTFLLLLAALCVLAATSLLYSSAIQAAPNKELIITDNVVIYQPAKPRKVHVDWYMSTISLVNDIKKYSSQGYVIKTLTSGGGGKDFVLVMELY